MNPPPPWSAPAAALIPWAAFIVTAIVADHSLINERMPKAAAFYLLFVGLPSLAPIAAARSLGARLAATMIMTATAAFAAFQMVSIDDGQAGLAVFWVTMVAFPLAIVLWIGQSWYIDPRTRDRAGPPARPTGPPL